MQLSTSYNIPCYYKDNLLFKKYFVLVKIYKLSYLLFKQLSKVINCAQNFITVITPLLATYATLLYLS